MSISIITACYNSVVTLPETLSSVRFQQGLAFEYILIDGGSSDGTLELIKVEHSTTDTPLSRWISEPDQGIYDALNKGIALAKGDVIQVIVFALLFGLVLNHANQHQQFDGPADAQCAAVFRAVRA